MTQFRLCLISSPRSYFLAHLLANASFCPRVQKYFFQLKISGMCCWISSGSDHRDKVDKRMSYKTISGCLLREKERGGGEMSVYWRSSSRPMASTGPVWICSMTGDSEGKSRHIKPSLWIDVISHRGSGSQSTGYCNKFWTPFRS